MTSFSTRSRVLGAALLAACAVAGCGGNGGAKDSQTAALTKVNACFADAGATKATSASDLAFAATDIANLKYANAGSTRVAGTRVYEVQSLRHPGYALFMVAKPGSSGEPNVSATIANPSSVTGVFVVKGDNPQYNRARTCLQPAA